MRIQRATNPCDVKSSFFMIKLSSLAFGLVALISRQSAPFKFTKGKERRDTILAYISTGSSLKPYAAFPLAQVKEQQEGNNSFILFIHQKNPTPDIEPTNHLFCYSQTLINQFHVLLNLIQELPTGGGAGSLLLLFCSTKTLILPPRITSQMLPTLIFLCISKPASKPASSTGSSKATF